MGELFGETNIYTAEWTEGIVSKLVKDAVEEMEGPNAHYKRCINFDGPVDALWIENMNTVLDDNKMLCLNNGQRIKMPDTCTMMFEVNDLQVASPATVSRCGMVYIEPVHLGWEPLVSTWSEKSVGLAPVGKDKKVEVPAIEEKCIPQIKETVFKFLKKLLPIVRGFKEAIPSVDCNLVSSCLKLISIFLCKDNINLAREDINVEKVINNYIIFCVVWSIGANI
jgi:dynein heavy chain